MTTNATRRGFEETGSSSSSKRCDALLAVQMWTHFVAKHDADETLFGPVVTGDCFDYRGLILYELNGHRFSSITVAYNSFLRTDVDGTQRELGMPH